MGRCPHNALYSTFDTTVVSAREWQCKRGGPEKGRWFVHNGWAAAQRFFDAGRASIPRVRRHLVHICPLLDEYRPWLEKCAVPLGELALFCLLIEVVGRRSRYPKQPRCSTDVSLLMFLATASTAEG